MKQKIIFFILLIFFIPALAFSQKDTLVKKLDSLSRKEDSLHTGKNNNVNPTAYNDSTKITFRNYFVLLGNDVKQQFTFPFHAKKRDWIRFGAFVGFLYVVSYADETVSKNIVSLRNSSNAISSVSSFITNFGSTYEVYSLLGIGTYGFVFKNEKIKTTFFLASQSYIIAGAIEGILKFLSKRQRPDYIDPQTGLSDPTFHGPFFTFPPKAQGTLNSSFPSGHTTAAFAAATVYAMEYRHHPWIPIAAYSFATLVGISRLTEDKHWPTDVLFGAAIGFLSGKQVVNNYHRYMKIKQPERPVRQRRGTLTFNLHPFYDKVLPGVTYTF